MTELRPVGDGGRVAALVRLDGPARAGSIDRATLDQLGAAIASAGADDRVCVVLLHGRGPDFCVGLDPALEATLRADAEAYPTFLRRAQEVFRSIREVGLPVVALVGGRAVGLGFELTLWCDFVYCGRSATFGAGAGTVGQSGGAGALTLLPRLAGLSFAREVAFTGRAISAEQAYQHRLVNRVVADYALLDAGLAFAADASGKFPTAIAYAKNVINTGWHQGLGVDSALSLELERAARYAVTASVAP